MNRNKTTDRQILAVALATMILSTTAFAAIGGFSDPSWRGNSNTTFQQWTFSADSRENVPPDSYSSNPPSTHGSSLYVDTSYFWQPSISGAGGVWPLGELDIFVPNFPNGTEKQIWIQLTWQGAGNSTYMPDQPAVSVVPDYSSDPAPYLITYMPRKDYPLVVNGNNWNQSLFQIDIKPNPSEEWIVIKGDILVDKVSIDTRCIPEPATLGLLIGGAFMAIRRKRKV